MGFGAGQIVYEDDLALFIAGETYQEITTVSVTSSTTPVDIPGSQFNVVAGATYWVDVWVAYNAAVYVVSTSGGARFSWLASDSDIGCDRNIQSGGWTMNATNNQGNQATTMVNLRRGTTTQQIVGASNGEDNAFTLHHEVAIVKSVAATDGTIKMQFAQGGSSATASVVQSGYMKITRVA